jgi:glycine betaine/proline transport system substrate-binding protein
VVEKELTEDESWEGLASGEVDAILENWGHDDLKKAYIDDRKVAVEQGLTGNKGVIGWYVPPWMAKGLLSEIKLVHIPLPIYKPGCDSDPETVACDYQPYDLDKIARKAFVDSGSPAADLIKNFRWSNDDQNQVARDITVKKLSRDDAAKRWLDANRTKWQEWLPAR